MPTRCFWHVPKSRNHFYRDVTAWVTAQQNHHNINKDN